MQNPNANILHFTSLHLDPLRKVKGVTFRNESTG